MTVEELRERLAEFPGYHEVLIDGRPVEELVQRTGSDGPFVELRR